MRAKGAGWRIELMVPVAAAPLFTAALERFADAVSGFETGPGDDCRLLAYGPAEPDRGALQVALALAAAAAGVVEPVPRVAALPETDWLAESRRRFPPVRAGRYLIHGSDDRHAVPPGAIGLCLDAATAFGTGRHGTTRGCLMALDRLATRRRRVRRVLDIGCGTGILAIAASRTWRAAVVAADVDPEAVRVARRNVRLNGVASLVRVVRSDGMRDAAVARAGPYDLITANLFARLLRRLAPDIAGLAAPGGTVVLSGFLEADRTAVVAAHRAQGLRPVERLVDGDWITVVMSGLARG